MDLQLADKVFIVTGGSSGIGAAISRSLAEEGAVPVIFDRAAPEAALAEALARVTARSSWSWMMTPPAPPPWPAWPPAMEGWMGW